MKTTLAHLPADLETFREGAELALGHIRARHARPIRPAKLSRAVSNALVELTARLAPELSFSRQELAYLLAADPIARRHVHFPPG